jgi:hypothetical protein
LEPRKVAGDERQHLIEDGARSIQLFLPYLGTDAVRPVALTFLDLANCGESLRCDFKQIGAPVSRVLDVRGEPLAHEQVGVSLHALASLT